MELSNLIVYYLLLSTNLEVPHYQKHYQIKDYIRSF